MKTIKPVFLIVIVVAVLLVLPLTLLKLSTLLHRRAGLTAGGSREFYMALTEPGTDLEYIEAHAEIRIPLSASEIHACIGCSNPLNTRVRFNLPPPDFPLFIISTYCDRPFSTLNPWDLRCEEHDPDWWQPDEAAVLSECTGGNSYVQQQILVDKANQKSHIIYVFTVLDDFETPAQ
ncbi:hypothetical protein EG832_14345 [bacterium]|nr:hypothetical protein [bacterium]